MLFASKIFQAISLIKSDKIFHILYMRKEIVSFMTEFNFIMFSALLGIVSFQKLNSGGF